MDENKANLRGPSQPKNQSSSASTSAPYKTWYPIYEVQVIFKRVGRYPLTIVRGLADVSDIYYSVLKRRLRCSGICRQNEFELFRVYPGDVVRLLRDFGFPDEYVTVTWRRSVERGPQATSTEKTPETTEDGT